MNEIFSNKILIEFVNNTDPEDVDENDIEIKFRGTIFDEGKCEYTDMFACEYDNVGLETVEHWIEDLAKYPSGLYWLHYNYSLEYESWEMPHIKYPIFEDFKMEKV